MVILNTSVVPLNCPDQGLTEPIDSQPMGYETYFQQTLSYGMKLHKFLYGISTATRHSL